MYVHIYVRVCVYIYTYVNMVTTRFGSVKGLYNFPNATDSFPIHSLLNESCSFQVLWQREKSQRNHCDRIRMSYHREDPFGITTILRVATRTLKDSSVTDTIHVQYSHCPPITDASLQTV